MTGGSPSSAALYILPVRCKTRPNILSGVRHRVGTGRVASRYVSPSPPPNRTGDFHRIRLSPFGQSPRNSRSVPSHFLSSVGVHPRTACAVAEYLWSGSFPKAGGLRLQSSSSCTRLSRARTTVPPLTSQKGIGLSYGSRLPPSTVLTNLPGISRVPTVGLNYDD